MLIVNRHKPMGRLGNQLELATHLVLFSLMSNQRVNIPFDDQYSGYFPHFRENLLNSFPRLACKSASADRLATALVRIVTRIGMLRVTDLMADGDWIYFDQIRESDKHGGAVAHLRSARLCAATVWRFRAASISTADANTVREVLRPVPEVLDFARRQRQSLACDVVVGVHIRLGDFRRAFPDRVYPLEYYRDRLREVTQLFPGQRVGFMVCSDEGIERELDAFRCVFPNGDPVQDLFSLAQCDYLLGARSTFSRWAAFWGDRPLCVLESEAQRIGSRDDFRSVRF